MKGGMLSVSCKLYEDFPLSIYIDLINSCNLHCAYCYFSPTDKKMGFSKIKEIINEASAKGTLYMHFAGGEPLLRKDVFKIGDYARQKGICTSITTNGTLITKENADKLAKSFSFVQISLDGPKEIHDCIRGAGSFDRTVKGIKNILAKRDDICIGCVIHKKNVPAIEEFIDYLIKLGVSNFRTIRLKSVNKEAEKTYELSQYARFLAKLSKLKRKKKIRIHKAPFDFLLEGHMDAQNKVKIGCGAGFVTCSITADGFLVPCTTCPIKRTEQNNLLVHSIEEAWRNSNVFKKWRNEAPNIRGKCNTCTFFEICGGGCRAASYFKYGDYTSRPIVLDVGRDKLKLLFISAQYVPAAGGSEQSIHTLLRALVKKRHKCSVITFIKPERASTIDGVHIYEICEEGEIEPVLLKIKPDIILTQLTWSDAAVFLANKHKLPSVFFS